jgi:hypothetical protein
MQTSIGKIRGKEGGHSLRVGGPRPFFRRNQLGIASLWFRAGVRQLAAGVPHLLATPVTLQKCKLA